MYWIGPVIGTQIRVNSVASTYCSTTSSVLSTSPGDVGDLVIPHNFIIAVVRSGYRGIYCGHGTNIAACFSPAAMASLALSPYFSKSFSPPVTWRSRRGFPIQKTV